MTELKSYKCVNCGNPAPAIFKSYGPSVLKLTKCESCNGTVDKYVEYDPVIVMIDLVLMSREAQRHVIYNTDFKTYWKLFITLMMLETYGVWRSDSLSTIGINVICQNSTNNNFTQLNDTSELYSHANWLDKYWPQAPFSWLKHYWLQVPSSWLDKCWAWNQPERVDDGDLFIWEKDFYIQFIATFCGIAAFLSTTYCLMYLIQRFSSHIQVPFLRLIKAFSLANTSIVFTIPMLVWGNAETPTETRTLHYVLVFAYSFSLFFNVYTVLYERHMLLTLLVLSASHCAKFYSTFNAAPLVRGIIT